MKNLLASLVLGSILGLSGGIATNYVSDAVAIEDTHHFIKEMRDTVGSLHIEGTPDAVCSAVKINPRTVLTAAHCVGDVGSKITFVDPITKIRVEAVVIKTGKEGLDLALLALASYVPGPYALLAPGFVQDESAYAVGFPLAFMTGGNQVMTKGVVQGIYKLNPTLILTDVPLIYGNSGGALFNSKGELLGITVAGIPNPMTGSMTHLTMSVHINVIRTFLQ